MSDEERSAKYQVRALERGLAILSAFDGIEPMLSPTELAHKTGLPKPTVFRLLQVLAEAGYVEKAPEDETCYTVGARAMGLGGVYLSGLRIPVLAQPLLDTLQVQTGETAMFGVLQRDQVLLLAVSLCRRDIAVNTMVGVHYEPSCTALGKVLLTGLRDDTLQSLLGRVEYTARTRRTITSRPALARDLKFVAERGWALEDEEREPGVLSIAAPVFGENGLLAGAIGIAAPKFRIPANAVSDIAARVIEAADDLTRQLLGTAAAKATQSGPTPSNTAATYARPGRVAAATLEPVGEVEPTPRRRSAKAVRPQSNR